jgi:hypothetical protein
VTIREKLLKIQSELKAPKNQRNDFGKYNYRSCEDILEAVKPLCEKHSALLVMTDDVVLVGDRHYIKSTASLCDVGNVGTEFVITASAYAREPLDRKGMDSSQITGATASYSRKYALNALFCIDDTKDADETNDHSKPEKKQKGEFVPAQNAILKSENIRQLEYIQKMIEQREWTEDELEKLKETAENKKRELSPV